MNDVPNVGELCKVGAKRDAIHVAVIPVVAALIMRPGDRVALNHEGKAYPLGLTDEVKPIGIVDPFLNDYVRAGETFWLFMMPNSITSLRHVWTHPAFRAKSLEELTDGK